MQNDHLIKIAIADDHKIFRDGIKMALSGKANLKMLWEAEDGKEIDGINAIQLIRKEYEDIKIIVLTMYDDQQMISKMMEMGANAYLTKTTDPEEIYEAILTCMNDDFYFNELVNKAVMGKLMQKKNVRQHYGSNTPINFNEKELKILQLLSEDKTTEEISKIIFLSPRTIETIRQNMKTKVDAKTIGGLIMYGMRNKLIE